MRVRCKLKNLIKTIALYNNRLGEKMSEEELEILTNNYIDKREE